ncbi:MAG: metalloregulator ArsR/SmtB family transcription factor [Rhodanobacteraceae bacterium]
MSTSAQLRLTRRSAAAASVFAALGDPTRLNLVAKLSDGSRRSISQLADGEQLTRQAVRKHLQVLETASVVSSRKTGRESLFALNPKPLDDAGTYIALVSGEWDRSLARLKSFVKG